MKLIHLIGFLAFVSGIPAQNSESFASGMGCCDSNGVQISPNRPESIYYTSSTESVKHFRRKNKVSISIGEYILGNTIYKCDVKYSGRIKSETPILNVGNNRGVQLSLGRAEFGGEKVYLYRLSMWEYFPSESCWKPLAFYNTMSTLYSMRNGLNGHSVGYRETSEYMEVLLGEFEVKK